MMILDVNPATHSRATGHVEGDTFTVLNEQDVTRVIEQNKGLLAVSNGGAREDVNWVASLPLVVYWDLKQRGILDDEKRFRQWLDDRDNLLFRTNPMRLSR